MKGVQGLIIAIFLGLAGAIANYFYLSSEARKIEMVSFIGIKPGVIVGRGERLKADSFVPVEIPKNAVGNLRDFAFLWTEKSTVENVTTWRPLADGLEGTLVMRSDIKTPPPELDLGKDETAVWIPVDSRAFVPALLSPGDMVSFRVPSLRWAAVPTPAGKPAAAAGELKPKAEEVDVSADAQPAGPTETIGPFKVLSVGNRLGSAEVLRASGGRQAEENVLTIRVSKQVVGEAERAEKLLSRLQAVNFRQVGLVLHGKP
jgi:hypothetical protein